MAASSVLALHFKTSRIVRKTPAYESSSQCWQLGRQQRAPSRRLLRLRRDLATMRLHPVKPLLLRNRHSSRLASWPYAPLGSTTAHQQHQRHHSRNV
ncbi:hypothetical protein V5799_025200 [Amblyomma americanum]|uniref:Uncharacterized protein n=1 Tax=Amblyomma americanum TaxID=6943 RepID=A0AAQ4EA46_AMBAM